MNPHAPPVIAPMAWLTGVVRDRSLLAALVRRYIAQRYRGSWLGWGWQLLQPALMLAIYTFLFAGVFGARWPGTDGSKLLFGLVLYAALLVHGCLADLANRAPSLVPMHASYVKRVVFPLHLLPVMALGTTAFQFAAGFAILVAGLAAVGAPLHAALVSVPAIVAPLLLLALGLAYLLAALGVFMRDLGQIVTLATTLLLFISPVFFPASALPSAWRPWLALNPLTWFIEAVRAAVVQGAWPPAGPWLAWLAAGLGVAWAGFAGFQLVRKDFADVL